MYRINLQWVGSPVLALHDDTIYVGYGVNWHHLIFQKNNGNYYKIKPKFLWNVKLPVCHTKVMSCDSQGTTDNFKDEKLHSFFLFCVYVFVFHSLSAAARRLHIKFRWVNIWFWNISIFFRWPCRLRPFVFALSTTLLLMFQLRIKRCELR